MRLRTEEGDLVVDDGRIELRFDGRTGGVSAARNLTTGHVMVDNESPVPWRIVAQGRASRWFSPDLRNFTTDDPTPSSFEYSIDESAQAAILSWQTTDPGLWLTVRVEEDPDGGIALWPTLSVDEAARPPIVLTYPILGHPREFSDGGTSDCLVFPGHAGWLVRSPLAAGKLETRYPDGYAGASTQFMAYFERGAGGFYMANHDPHSTAKYLRFGAEEWSFDHEAWDIRRGADLDLDYPIVIDGLLFGDWYESADRYRTWALPNAPWCRDHAGNSSDESRDGARWLFEDVGLSIWCAPARLDWAQWYRHYADVADTPLHVVPAWDWPETLPPSLGYEGVFPATFHPANVEAWKGHRVTPYLNDLFVSLRAPDFLERWEPNLIFPYFTFQWTPFAEPNTGWVDGEVPGPDPFTSTNLDFFICPATEEQIELHAWRDKVMADEYGLDGIFYDISSGNNTWLRCLRAEHGHTPGRGRELIDAYEHMNRRSKEAAFDATGRYLTQGTEVIQENVIGSIDFYVSRACAGPMGRLETEIFGPEDPPGVGRELIPLFQAVYHDIGPVHEDGWITLSEREGSFFYFVAARITLVWGGILSLQYCTEAPEEFAGRDADIPAETILWDGATVKWDEFPTADPEKEEFVRELAAARTSFANEYLAYGRMLRPPAIADSFIALDFHQRFYGWGADGWRVDGEWDVPRIMVSAWEAPDASIGIVACNLGREMVDVPLRVDLGSLWSVDRTGGNVNLIGNGFTDHLGIVDADNTINVTVAASSRRVVVIAIPA